ncbi:MAG: tetratricopeptide repeat protein [Acidobacteriota bacterium]
MNCTRVPRGILAGLLAVALVAVVTPAYAQQGGLTGRIVDEAGKPVPDAEMTFDYTGELNLHFTGKANGKGEWARGGLMAVGRWSISAKKGDLSARINNVEVPLGGSKVIPDIVIKKTSGANAGDAAKTKESAALQKTMTEVGALMAAQSYDEAITKLNETTTANPTCALCYVKLGDAYVKKSDMDNAEKSYQKAIETDPASADAYEGMASLYNQQKKFDDAVKMSAKSIELRGASGVTDPTALFNQGVIFWNQSKIAEAKAQFEKVIAANPKMAEAHYYYGMALINEGKTTEARPSFQTYLQLAPTGANADTAKAILESLK